MLVPCCLYSIQNNLLLLAVANLDPPVYYLISQVTSIRPCWRALLRCHCEKNSVLHLMWVSWQLKILATAFFSVLILGKTMSICKWFALLLLVFGTSISQLDSGFQGNVSSLGCCHVLYRMLYTYVAPLYFVRLRRFNFIQGSDRQLARSVPQV